MSDTLIVTSVRTGAEYDRVSLTDAGKLAFATGRARTLFAGLYKVRPALSESEMFALRRDWSNGYLQMKPAA